MALSQMFLAAWILSLIKVCQTVYCYYSYSLSRYYCYYSYTRYRYYTTSNPYTYYTYYTSSTVYYFSGGVIAGIVVGCLVFIGVIISVTVAICKKKSRPGTVIQPFHQPTVVTVAGSSTYAGNPPPYPGGPPGGYQPVVIEDPPKIVYPNTVS